MKAWGGEFGVLGGCAEACGGAPRRSRRLGVPRRAELSERGDAGRGGGAGFRGTSDQLSENNNHP